MKLKICGIKSLQDLLFCIDNNVDYVGINFCHSSKRFVKYGDVLEKINSINLQKTTLVAVFYNNSFTEIEEIINKYNFKIIQFSSKYIDKEMIKISNKCELWQAVNVDCYNEYQNLCHKFLFDSSHGQGKLLNQKIPESIDKKYGIAGGVSVENISKMLLSNQNADFFDIASGVESDGKFSLDKLQKIVQLIK
jgi:phosphoribosylanthranilate isomerase